MFFVYVIVFMLILGVIIMLLNEAEKGLMKVQGYSSQVLSLTHIGGIPLLKEGSKSHIGTMEDKLEINKTHFLPLERVKRVQYLSEEQLVDKQKSVLKRAIVGGLLLGPVAAIIGGISGVGTKQTKETHHFLSIDFLDKSGDEQTAVFLVGELGVSDIKSFLKDVNEKVGYEFEKTPVPSVGKQYEI